MRWKIFLLILSLLLGSSAMGSELSEIRKAIKEKGAKWEAGETSVSKLSPEERRKLCGAIREERKLKGLRARGEDPPDVSKLFPWDWRNRNGLNWTTPIRNQASCGSCVAFGTVGALEANIKIYANNHWLPLNLSEQHLFSCGRGPGGCAHGWSTFAAMNYLKNYGTPDEACLPYTAVDDNCDQTCSDWEDRARKTSDWGWISPDVSSIKGYLTLGPLPAYIDVYTDFFSYHGGIYEHVSGELEGGHLITVVGWNNSEDCWICKNSWGSQNTIPPGNWGEDTYGVTGEKGWFRIKWGECAIETGVVWLTPIIKGSDGAILEETAYQFYLPPDSLAVDTLLVFNTGSLGFVFDITSYPTWLSPSITTDTLSEVESVYVEFEVSSAGLSGGAYAGTLMVEISDTTDAPPMEFPVSVDLYVSPLFVRGDVAPPGAQDGACTMADGLMILGYYFGETGLDCMDAGDVDDNGVVTMGDGLRTLGYYYGDPGTVPEPPFPDCGLDPTTDDDLYCSSHTYCIGGKAVAFKPVSLGDVPNKLVLQAVAEDGMLRVPVDLVISEDVLGCAFLVDYDASKLSFVGLVGGEEYDFYRSYVVDETLGLVRIGCIPDLELKDVFAPGEHRVAELEFRVKGSVAGVEFGLDEVEVVNRSFVNVPVEWVVKTGVANLPTEFALRQNYPNPFNPTTQIKYDLPVDCQVRLDVYNVVGQRVATLVDGHQKAGYKLVSWNARDMASGVYFYKLVAGDYSSIKKMVVLK